jgi:hypothetical protein
MYKEMRIKDELPEKLLQNMNGCCMLFSGIPKGLS